MRHFATESGKSKGQFYTPAEASRMMAKVIGAGRVKPAAVFRFVKPRPHGQNYFSGFGNCG